MTSNQNELQKLLEKLIITLFNLTVFIGLFLYLKSLFIAVIKLSIKICKPISFVLQSKMKFFNKLTVNNNLETITRTIEIIKTMILQRILQIQSNCIIRLIKLKKYIENQIPNLQSYALLNSRMQRSRSLHQQKYIMFLSQILILAKFLFSVLSKYCYIRSKLCFSSILLRIFVFLILTLSLWHETDCLYNSVKFSTNTVQTRYGVLRGIVVRSSPLVEAFLGVPYASPPVGSLRFMPPITPTAWKNVRNSDRFSPVCPQTVPIPPNGPEALLEVPRARLAQLRRLLPLLTNQSEDCLYLNVYVPYEKRRQRRSATTNSENENKSKLSTILFIHGESYEWNSGNPYDASDLAAHGKIIVVTINFRLGIFGFLKTGGKESAQGNFGLMDLVAGIHWLKENLPAFGGDPQSITLLGHGPGAALANILVTSPVANDLITRIVMISGSALSPWAIQKNPLYVKRRVAEQTGCHGDMLLDDLAPCLRTKSVAELLSVKIDHPRFLVGFAPFVDGTVISSSAEPVGGATLPLGSAIASMSGIEYANFPKKDLIFCLTSTESYLDLSAQDLEFGFNETRRDRILRTFVRNNFHYHLNEIFAVLKNEYTDWEKSIRNPLSSRDATLSFLSDGHTAAALIKLGYMHSLRGGRSYFLHFKHKTFEEEYPQRTGSVRGEDVPFWFGLPISPLFPHNYTTQEKQISRLMLQYLSNFAKSGNPNQKPDTERLTVKRSSQKPDLIYKNINYTNIHDVALNLAVLYNQRRSNTMRFEKHPYIKRRSRSNDNSKVSLKTTNSLPFWDAYDIVNQLYLELENSAEIQSHYRGHKLSMWLNLVPQLHKHTNINDQSMRHHQFPEDMNNQRDLYEGEVRAPILTKPLDDDKTVSVIIQVPKTTMQTIIFNITSRIFLDNSSQNRSTTTTVTECGVDGAYLQDTTLQPSTENRSIGENQKDLATASTGLIGNLEVLRRLSGKQFQSYTTALVATIAVGCFLLILNVLIFAGIYHQREKRARDAKTKEELQDNDKDSSLLKLNTSRKSSTQNNSSLNDLKMTKLFGEYNCYDEKLKQAKDNKLLVDLSQMFDANWTGTTNTLDLIKSKNYGLSESDLSAAIGQTDVHLHPINNIELTTRNPLTIPNALELKGTELKRNSFPDCMSHSNQFDYAVQSSDQMSFKEIENAVKTNSIGNTLDDDIPEPPPPPRSFQAAQHHQQQQQQLQQPKQQQQQQQQQQSGILRQSGSNAGGKKRVHIQEISV